MTPLPLSFHSFNRPNSLFFLRDHATHFSPSAMDRDTFEERFATYKGFTHDRPEQVIQGYDRMSPAERDATASLLRG